uniref:hydrogenase maturation protease n=1 Tax=Ferrovum myxofaciens TaxID=416213 RepID=UPI0004E1AE28
MKSTQLLILGIGNILWADEGFGVRCVEAMNVAYQFGHDVVLMDGGTQGLYLLPPDYVSISVRIISFFPEQGVAYMSATASLGTIAARSNLRLNRY